MGISKNTTNSSQRGNDEKIEKKNHNKKDSCEIYLNNNNEDELQVFRNRKPLEFASNYNDITYLNNKENINDIDDEGIINKTNDYKNFFKGVEIYQNKPGLYLFSEPNIGEFTKHCEANKIF